MSNHHQIECADEFSVLQGVIPDKIILAQKEMNQCSPHMN